jgi:hypothetical protein
MRLTFVRRFAGVVVLAGGLILSNSKEARATDPEYTCAEERAYCENDMHGSFTIQYIGGNPIANYWCGREVGSYNGTCWISGS